jgi:hypothetical protein
MQCANGFGHEWRLASWGDYGLCRQKKGDDVDKETPRPPSASIIWFGFKGVRLSFAAPWWGKVFNHIVKLVRVVKEMRTSLDWQLFWLGLSVRLFSFD